VRPHFHHLTGHYRSEHIENPFTIDVLHVVISKASEPKLFAMRDRTAPVQFQ
jgi:hypothetical protein